MKCIYINLDSASARRLAVEQNFAQHRHPGWELERFPAVDALEVERQAVPGAIRAGEKGCFLSHKAVITRNLDTMAPILVMEDDAIWGCSTSPTIENFLSVSDHYAWDIIFTDVCIPQPAQMLELIRKRHELTDMQQVTLLDLSEYVFAGSTSYVVNHRSIRKLHAFMDGAEVMDLPYDLWLRKLVFEGKLKALAFFPFITSLSDDSDASQIQQAGAADMLWNAFRKLVWVDRDLAAVTPLMAKIDAELGDEESRLFGKLFSGLASKSFVSK